MQISFNNSIIPNKSYEHEESLAQIELFPDSLPIDHVVNHILNTERQAWVSMTADKVFKNLIGNFDEEKEKKEILKFETILRKVKPLPTHWDSYEAAGGLQWSMNLSEIKAYTQQKFDNLRKSGILLFRSEFEKQEDPKKFRTLGVISKSGQKSGSLERLWGAEYLRTKLAQEEFYRVPRFILVIEDNVETLPVLLCNGDQSLFISSIATDKGEVLVEEIRNVTWAAHEKGHRWMHSLGYVDYSDPGNILKGEDGKYYVVDTEWKSLSGVLDKNDEDRKVSMLRDYAIKRFKTFNPWLSKTINIELYK